MPIVTRIAAAFLVAVVSWTGLLAVPAACGSEVTMSPLGCSESGCCCQDVCLCPAPPVTPSPQPLQPAALSAASAHADLQSSGAVARHPIATALMDTPRLSRPRGRLASEAGPRRTDRALELFCILLV